MNFSIEESKENDLIIKAATGNIKTRTIRNFLFSLTLLAVRINNQGAPLLGLAKSIYYLLKTMRYRFSCIHTKFSEMVQIYVLIQREMVTIYLYL